MKQEDLRESVKKASPRVSVHQPLWSPDPLSPTPTISSAIKTPENTQEDPEP
jgi:hypothetical protein